MNDSLVSRSQMLLQYLLAVDMTMEGNRAGQHSGEVPEVHDPAKPAPSYQKLS